MPAALQAITRQLAEEHSGLASRSARISEHYRRAGSSRTVVAEQADAVAYSLTRMPATYAAVSRVMDELLERAPDFQPATMLDAGAGPGTAAWAAGEAYPELQQTLVDHNDQFLEIAEAIAGELGTEPVLLRRDLNDFAFPQAFDLVTCAYALTELADGTLPDVATRLWEHTSGILVIVEPGRPRDYHRLMRVRSHLIQLGGRVIAPCPHDAACPLVEPDWCHFAARLQRSRQHMQLKGGTLGYEDEKFSYLVIARPEVQARVTARVICPTSENKFSVTLDLCTPAGLQVRVVPSRDRVAFKAARKLAWGDAVDDPASH